MATEKRIFARSDWQHVMFEGSCDLNDPKTYRNCSYKNFNSTKLIELIYQKIGYAKMYVEYFHPDWDKKQVQEIEKMLFWLGKELHNHFRDTPESRFWLRKWLFMFEDLTENMC